MPEPVTGRLPQHDDEIALGARTLAAAGSHVGGIVRVAVLGGSPAPLKIVGTAVFPALSDGLALGQGGALTVGGLHHLLPPQMRPPFDTLLVRFRPDVSPQVGKDALAARLAHAGSFTVLGPRTPADLVNFGRVQNLPVLVGLALSGLTLLTIAHLLITSARRRRRDFAILRALGLTRGQIRRTVAWQAGTLIAAAALAIGLPVGIICGRVAWHSFAHQLGIVPEPYIPAQQFTFVPIALGLAVAIAALPAEAAARAQPTQVLRTE